ncbi:hypothetical protein NB311A_09641 [Nitrobacter sp. Nb-311A]|uniref:FkbM family methyltransferase n=1 Tax=Nitrobacter sp. Nb-311A TaxID=314253 RepID=UPI00006871D5|nr:FkbM family methyltransferase [Nitrobacter sp. Nb-311A]EAQ34232.1 hypothetical protein NB311A_09641 [Nitrobacter sp. Nb-311A]
MYDEMWIDVVDGVYLPRSAQFEYFGYDIRHMAKRARERLAGSLDYWTHLYRPSPGDTIIDVGAGVGVDALTLSPLIAGGTIHSIEAHPWTFSALEKTCELNGLKNVRTYNLAISDKLGTVWINSLRHNESNSIKNVNGNGHSTAVQAIELDRFVKQHQIEKINLLKMNIEGAEELAIKGMLNSIKMAKYVVIACHDFKDGELGTKKPVKEFLNASGFHIIERSDDPRDYVRDHVHGIRL